jgi:G-protein alpha subunit
MGVAEHLFEVPLHGRTVTWHLYDVGGARGQRHTWVPFFDEANAIIFVAPISAFDQVRKGSLNSLRKHDDPTRTVPGRGRSDEQD